MRLAPRGRGCGGAGRLGGRGSYLMRNRLLELLREGDGAGCAEEAEVDAAVMVGEETVTVTGTSEETSEA